jgi:hypothetical protein
MRNRGSCSAPSRSRLAVVAILAAGLSACEAGLPETPPPDLRITYTYDPGRLPRARRLEIRGRVARYREMHRPAAPIAFSFRLSDSQYARLYAKLRAHRALEITSTDRGPVYDRGGVTITIAWGERRHRLSNASNRFVDRRWHGDFRAILRAFEHLIAEARRAHAQTNR